MNGFIGGAPHAGCAVGVDRAGRGWRVAQAMRCLPAETGLPGWTRSEEHPSELQSLMRLSYAVFCLKKKNNNNHTPLAQLFKSLIAQPKHLANHIRGIFHILIKSHHILNPY